METQRQFLIKRRRFIFILVAHAVHSKTVVTKTFLMGEALFACHQRDGAVAPPVSGWCVCVCD